MSLIERIKKSTVANLVSGVLVIVGICYFVYTGNNDAVMFMAGTALGWLFKEVKSE